MTEWQEDRKNRCLSSGTNSVGLHFQKGGEKKENDKNTKIDTYKLGMKSMGGKTSRTCTVGAKI